MGEYKDPIESLIESAAIAGNVDILHGATVTRAAGESTIQFGKFVTILGQVYSYITPYVEKDHDYTLEEIVDLINTSGVLSVRTQKHGGKTFVNDDDVVTISECVVWTVAYLQTGVALEMIPAVVMTDDYKAADADKVGKPIWNCMIMKDSGAREGCYHRMFGYISGHDVCFGKIGDTTINLQSRR